MVVLEEKNKNLELENRELQEENSKTIEDNRKLLSELEELNSGMHDSELRAKELQEDLDAVTVSFAPNNCFSETSIFCVLIPVVCRPNCLE